MTVPLAPSISLRSLTDGTNRADAPEQGGIL